MLKFPFGKTHFRGRPQKKIFREELDFDPLFQELIQSWIIKKVSSYFFFRSKFLLFDPSASFGLNVLNNFLIHTFFFSKRGSTYNHWVTLVVMDNLHTGQLIHHFFSDKWPAWGWEFGTQIRPRGLIFWTMIFYNLKKIKSRSI